MELPVPTLLALLESKTCLICSAISAMKTWTLMAFTTPLMTALEPMMNAASAAGPGPQILGIDAIIIYHDSLYAEAIDEWWVFMMSTDTLLTYLYENPGCTDPAADNYGPYAEDDEVAMESPVALDSSASNTLATIASVVFILLIVNLALLETDGTGTTVENDADSDGVCDWRWIMTVWTPTRYSFERLIGTPCGPMLTAFVRCVLENDGNGTVVDHDADGDGVCDADEDYRLPNATACNYLKAATDPGMIAVTQRHVRCVLEKLMGLMVVSFRCGFRRLHLRHRCNRRPMLVYEENLRTEVCVNGDSIPNSLSISEWHNTTIGALSVYGERQSACMDLSPDETRAILFGHSTNTADCTTGTRSQTVCCRRGGVFRRMGVDLRWTTSSRLRYAGTEEHGSNKSWLWMGHLVWD